MGFTVSTDPDNFGPARGVENNLNLVLTFPVTETTTLAKGDFVTINSTGLVAKNATKEVAVDGICMAPANNASGGNADKYAPILVRGITEVDGFVGALTSSGYDTDIAVGAVVLVGENSTSTGQIACALDGAGVSDSTNHLGIALDNLAAQATADKAVKLRIYIDRFSATYTGWN